jgi:hypothetical protein
MKPYPEGARHMTVMAAMFAIFAAYAAEWAADRLPARFHASVVAAMIATIAIVPAVKSYRLVQSAHDDTQIVAHRIIASLTGPSVWAMPSTSGPPFELNQPIETIVQTPGFVVLNERFAEQHIGPCRCRVRITSCAAGPWPMRR